MSTDLRQALHDLADDRPPAAPPADLWARGVRRARRRRSGAMAVAAALVAVVGALATGLPVSRPSPQPADVPGSRLHIPDHLYRLSGWAKGTDDLGPPGPVAVLMRESGVRRHWWFGTRDAMVAVSAVDGSYRFLDLPDADLADPGTEPRLSPDGRKVGYVYTRPAPGGAYNDRAGVAIYDTVTGAVLRHPIPNRYGLEVEELGWSAESDYLVVDVGKDLASEGSSTSPRLLAVGVDGGTARPRDDRGDVYRFGTGPDGGLAWVDEKSRLVVWHPPSPELRRVVRYADGYDPVFSPDGSQFVLIRDVDNVGARLFTGETGAPEDLVRTRPLAGHWQAEAVYGWKDDHQVLAAAHPAWGNGYRVVTVDLRTGVATRSIPVERERVDYVIPQFATDLVDNGWVPGRRPPSHLDPRPVAFGLAAVLVLGLGWLWGRRRRAAR